MSYDITPHVVAADLRAALARLDALTREVRTANQRKAHTLAAYRLAKAKARTASTARTVDLRDADVDENCYEQMLARNVAEAEADAVLTEATNLRTICTGFQSLLRLAETEARLDDTPGLRRVQ